MAPPTDQQERAMQLMRGLTVLQHVLIGVLLVVGFGQAWREGAARLPLLVVTVAFALWYAGGARRASHHELGAPAGPGAAGGSGRAAASRGAAAGAGAGTLWLLVLTGLWVAAVTVSAGFVWVAFGLWLLGAHLLPLGRATAYALVVLVIVVAAPVLGGGAWTVAGTVGPAIGAAFAVGLARGQVLLARDALERARLVDSLVRAQAESAELHDQLLLSQREAGALAERTRLSRDIHDTLAQGFSSILLLARGASVTPDEEGLRRLLGRVEETAADNLGEARRVVGALAPAALEDSGLAAALRRILDDVRADTGIATELRIDPSFPPLGMTEEVALLRTAQGALANVRSHSGAGRVVVSLEGAEGEARLDVVDDGRGFDAASVEASWADARRDLSRGGYGLASTRARLRELGGGLTVESAPGEGTALSAYLPLRTPGSAQPPSEIRPTQPARSRESR